MQVLETEKRSVWIEWRNCGPNIDYVLRIVGSYHGNEG